MRKISRAKRKNGGKPAQAVVTWLLCMLAVCILIKSIAGSELGKKIETELQNFAMRDGTAETILSMEMGSPFKNMGLVNVALGAPDAPEEAGETDSDAQETVVGESAIPEEIEPEDIQTEQIETFGKTVYDLVEGNVFTSGQTLDNSVIELDNTTGYEVDTNALLNQPLNMTINPEEPTVLIVHTHGSEAYTPAGDDIYAESDSYRTEDNNYNVVRVGEELKNCLEAYGISVIHNTTLHDYPSYNGAYDRAAVTISDMLKQYPTIKIVIDLHRDAILNMDGSVYKSTANVNGSECSQLLFVMGTDKLGANFPHWQENLQMAVKLQYALENMYPSITKPILISEYGYNQGATNGSMILEVGCNGNTLQESLAAVRYFADGAAEVIASAIEKN